MSNFVIAVTNHASGQTGGLKSHSVIALLKHLVLEGVAFRADIMNAVHSGGSRPVVAMASGAGWRTEVTADSQSVMVHAVTVLRELIGGDGIPPHIRSVCMTTGTRLRDVEWMNFGARVAGRPQVMHAMAIDAHRDLAIAFGKKFAVHTGLVLAELIGAQSWVVLAHERHVGMATAAKLWDLTSLDVAAKSSRLAHGIGIGFGGIAAMTIRTGQTFLRVDVAGELLGSDL
jgi:hypothetical protein